MNIRITSPRLHRPERGVEPRLQQVVLALLLAMFAAPAWALVEPEPEGESLPEGADSERRDSVASYQHSIDLWHQERVERLTQSDSWLSLVGLFWLQEGSQTVGSAADSDWVLPAGKAPARMAVLHRRGEEVELRPEPGVKLQIDDQIVTANTVLASDGSERPTIVMHGSLSFFLIARGERLGIRLRDSESQALADFAGIPRFPVDRGWQVPATLESYDPPKPIMVPNVLGDRIEVPSPGALVFERAGQTFRLDALPGGDGQLWLIFADATNRKQSYGAGRFLYVDLEDENGQLMIDFNKSYNPPCAFSDYATCPLPPPQNRLELAVTAGEMRYARDGH